jgi:hypothetical protein
MCAQRDAMREVRAAAECLSAVCRARASGAVQSLARFYDAVVEESVPAPLARAIDRLGTTPKP